MKCFLLSISSSCSPS
ncbi:hypothetical protein YPPY103_2341, partial [Yersinia pestis PY-103]